MTDNQLIRKSSSPGSFIRLVTAALLAGLATLSIAQDRISNSSSDTSQEPELVGEDTSALIQTVASLQRALAEYNGVYDESASEVYLGLADAYTRLGNFAEANSVYSDALQSLRITTGLYSEPQLDLLDRYTISAAIENDWSTVDTNLNLAHVIADHLYGSNDARYTDAVSRYASWKITAYELGIFETLSDRSVREAVELYDDLIDSMSPTEEGYRENVARYLSAKGMGHYHSALYTASIPLDDFPAAAEEYIIILQCHIEYEEGPNGVIIPVRVCEEVEVVNPDYFVSKQAEKDLQMRSQLAGMRTSFRQAADLIQEDPQATLEEKAEAILNLGDANFLIQEFRQANTQYSRADQLLSSTDTPEGLRERMIGQPRKILADVMEELPFDFVLETEDPVGTVSFDVNTNGDIENINITGLAEALSEYNQGLVMERLGRSVYRPKIENGRPVDSRLQIPAAEL